MIVRTTFSAIILLFTLYAYGQITDDFSDGNFSENPVWSGNTEAFIVDDFILRSNNDPDAGGLGEYYLSTPSKVSYDATWEFFVDLKFATSGANYVDVWLMSDQQDLTSSSLNGYFVRLGGTLDEIVLYKSVSGTVSTMVDFGDGIVNSSSSNPFKIQVSRSVSDIWELKYDEENTGSYLSGGTFEDSSVTASNYFGVLIIQSGAAGPINNHFFDDFLVTGRLTPDNTLPTLSSVSASSATQVLVDFSEDVDVTTAEITSNYAVSGVSITNAEVVEEDSSQVLLTVSALTNGQTYVFTVNNVEDRSGNSIASNTSASFDYFVLATPGRRDIVINEFTVDPSPLVGLPEAEFVELFNPTDDYFDLSGFKIKEIAATGTTELSNAMGDFILAPGAYVIVTGPTNTSLFESYGDVIGVSGFPSLNQSNSSILLLNPAEEIIDEIVYTTPPTDGITFEQINPFASCNSELNYAESTASEGGTPGSQNSVFDDTPDTTPPALSSYSISGSTGIALQFSEPMDSLSLVDGDYTLSGLSVTNIAVSGTYFGQVTLTFSSPLVSGDIYTLQISGVTDCEGNELSASLQFGLGRTPTFNELLITEIMADETPVLADLPEAEYIEIFNNSEDILSLADVAFTDIGDTAALRDRNLNPGQYMVICANVDEGDFEAFGLAMGISSFPSLANGGETLALIVGNDLINDVTYTDAWHEDEKSEGGYALELKDVNNPCGDKLVWGSSESEQGGTPGQPNSNSENVPDSFGPKLVSAVVIGENQARLQFSEKLEYGANESAEVVTSPALVVSGIFQDPLVRDQMIITFTENLQENSPYEIVVSKVFDCNGNAIASGDGSFVRPVTVDSLNVLITEVLFNPRTGGVDFVEIFNHSEKYFDLKNWLIGRKDDGELVQSYLISEMETVIAPGQYLALTADAETLIIEYPKGEKENFFETGSFPSYPNDEGTVVLMNSLSNVLDEFSYDEDYHSSLLASVDGVSLERIDLDAPTQQADNWSSASSTVGFATPGYVNSQSFDAPQIAGKLAIEPKVFVPGSSSAFTQNFTTINYQFDGSDKFANVNIYDQYGRVVKQLANGTSLSTSGFLRWDGTNHQGEAVRVGYYVVVFEVYDGSGKKDVMKETVVVGWQ